MSGKGLGITQPISDYVEQWGVREQSVLTRCREETAGHPRCVMQIDADQGALMHTLACAIRPQRAIEVGVFTGYSSLAVALAMKRFHGEGARLVACELEQSLIDRARAFWREADVDDVIETRVGPGADSLQAMIDEGDAATFDWMFIDADKPNYATYYELGLTLLRPGGLMLVDNMLWKGQVADPTDQTEETKALRSLAQFIHEDERVDMTLATIGDGVSFVVRR